VGWNPFTDSWGFGTGGWKGLEDALFHGGLEDKFKSLLRSLDEEIFQPLYDWQKEFVNGLLDDPMNIIYAALMLAGVPPHIVMLGKTANDQIMHELGFQGYENYDWKDGLKNSAKAWVTGKVSGAINTQLTEYANLIPTDNLFYESFVLEGAIEGFSAAGGALVVGDSATDAFLDPFLETTTQGLVGYAMGQVGKVTGFSFEDVQNNMLQELPDIAKDTIAGAIEAELRGKEVTSEILTQVIAEATISTKAVARVMENMLPAEFQALTDDNKYSTQALAVLTGGIQNAVSSALSGGTGKQAADQLLASLDQLGQQDLASFFEETGVGQLVTRGIENGVAWLDQQVASGIDFVGDTLDAGLAKVRGAWSAHQTALNNLGALTDVNSQLLSGLEQKTEQAAIVEEAYQSRQELVEAYNTRFGEVDELRLKEGEVLGWENDGEFVAFSTPEEQLEVNQSNFSAFYNSGHFYADNGDLKYVPGLRAYKKSAFTQEDVDEFYERTGALPSFSVGDVKFREYVKDVTRDEFGNITSIGNDPKLGNYIGYDNGIPSSPIGEQINTRSALIANGVMPSKDEDGDTRPLSDFDPARENVFSAIMAGLAVVSQKNDARNPRFLGGYEWVGPTEQVYNPFKYINPNYDSTRGAYLTIAEGFDTAQRFGSQATYKPGVDYTAYEQRNNVLNPFGVMEGISITSQGFGETTTVQSIIDGGITDQINTTLQRLQGNAEVAITNYDAAENNFTVWLADWRANTGITEQLETEFETLFAEVERTRDDLGFDADNFYSDFDEQFASINSIVASAMDSEFDTDWYTNAYGYLFDNNPLKAAEHYITVGSKQRLFTHQNQYDRAEATGQIRGIAQAGIVDANGNAPAIYERQALLTPVNQAKNTAAMAFWTNISPDIGTYSKDGLYGFDQQTIANNKISADSRLVFVSVDDFSGQGVGQNQTGLVSGGIPYNFIGMEGQSFDLFSDEHFSQSVGYETSLTFKAMPGWDQFIEDVSGTNAVFSFSMFDADLNTLELQQRKDILTAIDGLEYAPYAGYDTLYYTTNYDNSNKKTLDTSAAIAQIDDILSFNESYDAGLSPSSISDTSSLGLNDAVVQQGVTALDILEGNAIQTYNFAERRYEWVFDQSTLDGDDPVGMWTNDGNMEMRAGNTLEQLMLTDTNAYLDTINELYKESSVLNQNPVDGEQRTIEEIIVYADKPFVTYITNEDIRNLAAERAAKLEEINNNAALTTEQKTEEVRYTNDTYATVLNGGANIINQWQGFTAYFPNLKNQILDAIGLKQNGDPGNTTDENGNPLDPSHKDYRAPVAADPNYVPGSYAYELDARRLRIAEARERLALSMTSDELLASRTTWDNYLQNFDGYVRDADGNVVLNPDRVDGRMDFYIPTEFLTGRELAKAEATNQMIAVFGGIKNAPRSFLYDMILQESIESAPSIAAMAAVSVGAGLLISGPVGWVLAGGTAGVAGAKYIYKIAKKLKEEAEKVGKYAPLAGGIVVDGVLASGGQYQEQYDQIYDMATDMLERKTEYSVMQEAEVRKYSDEQIHELAKGLADQGATRAGHVQLLTTAISMGLGKVEVEKAFLGAAGTNNPMFESAFDAATALFREGVAEGFDESTTQAMNTQWLYENIDKDIIEGEGIGTVQKEGAFGFWTGFTTGLGVSTPGAAIGLFSDSYVNPESEIAQDLNGAKKDIVFVAPDPSMQLFMNNPYVNSVINNAKEAANDLAYTTESIETGIGAWLDSVGVTDSVARIDVLDAVNDSLYNSSTEVINAFQAAGYNPTMADVTQFVGSASATADDIFTQVQAYVEPMMITTDDVETAANTLNIKINNKEIRELAGQYSQNDKTIALADLNTQLEVSRFQNAEELKTYIKDTHGWTQAQVDNWYNAGKSGIDADIASMSKGHISENFDAKFDRAVLNESEIIEAIREAASLTSDKQREFYNDTWFKNNYGTLIELYRTDVGGTPSTNFMLDDITGGDVLDLNALQTDVDYQRSEKSVVDAIRFKLQDDEREQGYRKYYDKDKNWVETTFATDIANLANRELTKNADGTIANWGYTNADIQTAVDTWKQNTKTTEVNAIKAAMGDVGVDSFGGTPELLKTKLAEALWNINGNASDAAALNQLAVDFKNKWGYGASLSDLFRLGHDVINQDLYKQDGNWTRNPDDYPRNPNYASGDNPFSRGYNLYRKYDYGGSNTAPDLDTYAPASATFERVKAEFISRFGYTPDDAEVRQFTNSAIRNLFADTGGPGRPFEADDTPYFLFEQEIDNYMNPRQLSNAEAEAIIVETYAKGTPEYNRLMADYGNKTGGETYEDTQTAALEAEIAGMVETARINAENATVIAEFGKFDVDPVAGGIDISSFHSTANGLSGIEDYVITNYPNGTHVNNLKIGAIENAITGLGLNLDDFTPEEIAGIAANITGTTKADIQNSVNAQSYVNTFTGALEYTADEARTDLAAALNITNVADIPADFDDYIISLADAGLTDALAAGRVANEVAAAKTAFGAYIQDNEELADALDGTITDIPKYLEDKQYTLEDAKADLRAELGLAADADVSAYDTYLEGLVDMTGARSDDQGENKVQTEIIGDQDLRDALITGDFSQSIPTDLSAYTGLASDESLQDRVGRITPTFKTDTLLDKEQDARNILDEAANFGDEGAYLSTDAGYEALVNYQAQYALDNDLDYAQFKASVIAAVNSRRYSEQEIAADITAAFPQEQGKTVAELKAKYPTLFDLAGTGNPQFDRDQTLTFDDLTISDEDLRGQLGDYTLPTDLSGFTGLASDKDLAGRVADYKAQPGVYDTVTTQIRSDIVTYLDNAGLPADNPNRASLIDYYSTGAGRSVFDGLNANDREARIANEVNLRDYTEREVAQDIINAFAPTNQDGSPKDVDTILLEKSTGVDGGVYDTLFDLAQEAQTNDTNFDATQRIAFANNVVTKQDAVDHFLGLGYSQSDIDTVPELKNAIEALSGVRTKADFGTATDVTTLQADTTVTALDIKNELKANKEAYGFVDDAAVDALDDDTLLADFGGNYYKNDPTTGLGTKLADATVSGDDIRTALETAYSSIDASTYTDQDLRDAGFTLGVSPAANINTEITANTVSQAEIEAAFTAAGVDIYPEDIADYLGQFKPTGTTFQPTAGELADTRYRRLQDRIQDLESGQLNPTDADALSDAARNIADLQNRIGELEANQNLDPDFIETDPVTSGKIDSLIQSLKDYLTTEQISELIRGAVGEQATEGGTVASGVFAYIDGLINQLDPRVGDLETAVGNPAADGDPSTGLYKLIDDLTLLGLDDTGIIAEIEKRIGALEGISETDAIALAAIGTADDAAGTSTLYGYLKQQNDTRDQRLDNIDLEIGSAADVEQGTEATGLYKYMDDLIASLPAGYTQEEMGTFATNALNAILGDTTSEDASNLYGYVNNEIATLAEQIGVVEGEVDDIQEFIDSLGKPDNPDTADIDETSGIYAYIRDAIANGSIDEAGAQTLIEQIFGTQAIADDPATTDIDESAAATGIYQYIDGLNLADTTSVSASIDAAVTNLQNYITGEGFQTEDDIRRLVGEIVGRPAREVTADDIAFVETMLDPSSGAGIYVDPVAGMSYTPEYTADQIVYDVNNDGVVDQTDLDILNQLLDPETYGDPTGLTGDSAFETTGIYDIFGDIQTQQELDAETNLNMFNELGVKLERDRQDDLARRAKEEQEQYMNELQQLSRVDVTTPDVAKIDYLYDLYGDSIFATPEQEALFASPYGARKRPTPMGAEGLNLAPRAAAEGGLITDQTDELLKLLGN